MSDSDDEDDDTSMSDPVNEDEDTFMSDSDDEGPDFKFQDEINFVFYVLGLSNNYGVTFSLLQNTPA